MKILSLSIDGRDFPYNHEETNSDYDPSPRRRARISTVAEGEKRKKKKASKFSKNKMQESEHTSDEFILSDTTTVSGVGSEFLS